MRLFQAFPSAVLPVVLLALLLGTAACTGSGMSRSSGDPNEITREEIQRVEQVSSAYSVVQRLRPNWLQKRGPSSVSNPGDIIVYVEGSRYGPPESLRQIDPLNVASMRWLTDDQATTRYGTGHDNGVILVRLRGSQ